MMSTIAIKDISIYHPETSVDNKSIASMVNKNVSYLGEGVLQKLFGIKNRRFAKREEQVSDLACKAALPILEKMDKEEIDFLIFASACADLIEPATCNIIQQKLGLTCPAIDIKNACNSFLSAIHTATAFIESGIYKNVLIVNGEKLSDAINFNIENKEHLQASLAAFSLGDAGAAALISKSENKKGIVFQKFLTKGKFWDLCTIKGGGSMFPHDASKNFFQGKTSEMRGIFEKEVKDFAFECFDEAGWQPEELDHLITHQVSNHTFDIICKSLGVDKKINISVFEDFGNTAAASIPMALFHGIKHKFKAGDKIAILGFAAGISASVQLIKW